MPHIGRHMRRTTILKNGNKFWFIRLHESPANSSWKEFLCDHQIQENFMIQFFHVGVMAFRVQIFAPNRCSTFYEWNILPAQDYGQTNTVWNKIITL